MSAEGSPEQDSGEKLPARTPVLYGLGDHAINLALSSLLFVFPKFLTDVAGLRPFLAGLVTHLVVGGEEPPLTAYRPGSIVCLELQQDGGWLIAWMLRPELLGGAGRP